MGAELERDVRNVITHGVRAMFPDLTALRNLNYYRNTAQADTPGVGVAVIKRMLVIAATDFDPGPRSLAIVELLAVDADTKKQRKLTGNDGLRGKAAAHYRIAWDHFSRTIEPELVADFASYLSTWDGDQHLLPSARIQLAWADIERAADQLWRRLERDFRPDVVVTMSGPGSFAAIYTMRLSPRDCPVVMAVTFPHRDDPQDEELRFREAATRQRWLGFSTSKWWVWIPPVLPSYPKGSKVLLLDDRIISGETQTIVRSMLEEQGLEVRCAALFGPRDMSDRFLVIRPIDGEFDMPWGPSSGRT